MKSFLSKRHRQLITAALVGFIFLAALVFPGQIAARQDSAEPTPTSTPLPNDFVAESGDTQGLMWGAGIILIIIVSGIVIQRIILKSDSNKTEGKS